MTPQGRKIWGSKAGQSLMKAMLEDAPKTPEHAATVQALKASGKATEQKPAKDATIMPTTPEA